MSIKRVFKSYIPSVNYLTQKGRTCVFQEGRYLTDHVEEIAELTKTVEDKSNPHIYIDPNESEIDTTLQDKIAAAQKEATLKVLEEEAAKKANGGAGNQQAQGTSNEQQVQNKTSMSPAQLLGVTNSAALSGMSKESNQK